jgi:hypothetical protein
MMAGNRMLNNGAELGFMSGSRGFYAAVACRTLSQVPGFASTDDASHTKRDSTKNNSSRYTYNGHSLQPISKLRIIYATLPSRVLIYALRDPRSCGVRWLYPIEG